MLIEQESTQLRQQQQQQQQQMSNRRLTTKSITGYTWRRTEKHSAPFSRARATSALR